MTADAILHAERGKAGAKGVVLVGERRAEECHDAVTHHLVHGALVVVDGFHHQLEDGVEYPLGLLGIAVGQQLHRGLQIGEEDGHLLALAFQRGPRHEDPFSQVGRRGGMGRARVDLGGARPPAGGAPALRTESR